jgi:hypothetical protein
MKLGSVIELQGRTGDHGMLNGQKCPGRQFLVIEVGVGGIYENLVRYTQCHLELRAYENQVLDPFAEALLDMPDLAPSAYAIRADYRFRHLDLNGSQSNPTIWFPSEVHARAAFDRVTRDAAIGAWRSNDQAYVLESVTVRLFARDKNEWHELEKKSFKADANT